MRPQLARLRAFNGAMMQGMNADGIKTAEGAPMGYVFAPPPPLPPFQNKSFYGMSGLGLLMGTRQVSPVGACNRQARSAQYFRYNRVVAYRIYFSFFPVRAIHGGTQGQPNQL